MEDILGRRIPERLQTWSFPDSSEQDSIANKIAAIQITLDDTTSHISDLLITLEKLREQQNFLQHQLTSCKSLLAPIRKLPLDLLVEIFRLLDFQTTLFIGKHHRREDFKDRKAVLRWKRAGGSLRSVCSAWNTLIVNTASFWSRVKAEFDCWEHTTLLAESSGRLEGLMCTLLERSQETPLDVYIVVHRLWPLASILIKPLLKQVHRWKHLQLVLLTRQFADKGLDCLESGLRTLETLVIKAIDGPSVGLQPVKHSKWFSIVPCLNEVEYIDIPADLLKLPWKQLSRLVVYNYCNSPPGEYIEILKRATNLRTLRFGILRSQMTTWESISLHNVTSLHTANDGDLQFLAWFAFPHLSELIIHGSHSDMPPFLSQVSQTLQRLEVTDSAGQLFPAAFFNSDLHFSELKELSVTTRRCKPGEVPLRMDSVASIRNRFPKLAKLTCTIGGNIAYAEWLAVFSSFMNNSLLLNSPGEAIEILLSVGPTFPDSSIPILRDIVSAIPKATLAVTDYYSSGGEAEITLDDYLNKRTFQSLE